MDDEADVCVIGSGAGGAPVALRVGEAGKTVVVLEKGPWLREGDFTKDEISACRRHAYAPKPVDEPQIVELAGADGVEEIDTRRSPAWSLANGSLVGGATNVMSGYFHRAKPIDFRHATELGPVVGADVADWPISYDDLEPFYAEVEREVGVSGRVTEHRHADRRSTPEFPFPPLDEHPVAGLVDHAARALGLDPFPVARAILSRPHEARGACSYSGYCAYYGCTTGAKGSSRASLLGRAIATGRCEVRARATVTRIESDERGRATFAEYVDASGAVRRLRARIFVVACQPIETARLLLLSTGPKHPRGLANRSGLVGKNLHFATVTTAQGDLRLDRMDRGSARSLASREPWVNRGVQDHYVLDRGEFQGRTKGGTLHFLLAHPNPIETAITLGYTSEGPLFGEALVRRIERRFRASRTLVVEAFADWLPTPETHVTLDPSARDRLGIPSPRVRIRAHPRSEATSAFLASIGARVLRRMGADGVRIADTGPSTNLAGGTCRFGKDAARSVLDPECRAHDVDNVFVTDASFLPSGGSAPHTFTVYANAFRVARAIVRQLG